MRTRPRSVTHQQHDQRLKTTKMMEKQVFEFNKRTASESVDKRSRTIDYDRKNTTFSSILVQSRQHYPSKQL